MYVAQGAETLSGLCRRTDRRTIGTQLTAASNNSPVLDDMKLSRLGARPT